MLILSVLLGLAGVALFVFVPAVTIHMRHPWPVYGLLAAAAVAAFSRAGAVPWRAGLLGLFWLGLAGAFAFYVEAVTQLDRGALALRPGDPFPAFELPTSDGGTFSSDAYRGERAVLYIFYRGDW